MKFNDNESYVVRKSLIEVAYKGTYERERKIVSEDALTGNVVEKTGKILYTIKLQINRGGHLLFYESEQARDADFNLIIKAIGD